MNKFIEKLKLIWQKIVRPNKLISAITFGVTIVCATVSLLNVCGVIPLPQWACYALYGITALFFAHAVYIIVLSVPLIKVVVKSWLLSFPLTSELMQNYDYRTLSFAIFSFIFGLLFAIYHQVMAILIGSLWFGALFVYYIFLNTIRAIALNKSKNELSQWKKYRLCAVLLLLLTLALSGTIVLMVRDGFAFIKYDIAIYATAAYTFMRLTLSIINMFKAKKTDNPSVKALRCIGLADSLVAILALQSTLLFAFASEDYAWANALTGGAVCLATIVIAIIMIKTSTAKIKQILGEQNNEQRQQNQ